MHLDRVEGLGEFLELEGGLGDDERADEGATEAHHLLRRVGIDPTRLVSGAYVDLPRAVL